MKKLLMLFVAMFTLALSINSCRDGGDWEEENGQFGFSINRDNSFNEKSVGEINQFKFNVVTNYDFSTIPMKFKYTSSLNGELKLNGQVLVANTEYPLTNKENIFEYKGLAEGSHKLTFNVTNDKGATKEEIFDFAYTLSDFSVNVVGGTSNIYQGDEITYVHKITPSNATQTSGYEIRFDSYNGDVKLNGNLVQLGQYYPIVNITNFLVNLKTNQIGQGELTYTIKNINSTRPFSIAQTILPRTIVITSLNPSATNVIPNTPMTLTGIITKSPANTNNNIKYKTWISSATNNQMSGVTTTNNVYTDYALGGNGSFTIPFNAVQTGSYEINMQVKDEFGNESAVKTFTVVVGFPLAFLGQTSAIVSVSRTMTGNYYSNTITSFSRTFAAQVDPAKISNIEYKLSLYYTGIGSVNGQPAAGQKEFTYTELINLLNNVNYNNEVYVGSNQVLGLATQQSAISNVKLKIKVTANDGSIIEQEIVPTVIYN